jgi:hypothetical protein
MKTASMVVVFGLAGALWSARAGAQNILKCTDQGGNVHYGSNEAQLKALCPAGDTTRPDLTHKAARPIDPAGRSTARRCGYRNLSDIYIPCLNEAEAAGVSAPSGSEAWRQGHVRRDPAGLYGEAREAGSRGRVAGVPDRTQRQRDLRRSAVHAPTAQRDAISVRAEVERFPRRRCRAAS